MTINRETAKPVLMLVERKQQAKGIKDTREQVLRWLETSPEAVEAFPQEGTWTMFTIIAIGDQMHSHPLGLEAWCIHLAFVGSLEVLCCI